MPPEEPPKPEPEPVPPAEPAKPVEVREVGSAPPSAPPDPPAANPAGLPDGGPSGSTEDIVGGGGSTEQRLTKLVENFANSRVTINLDATGSMAAQRDAITRVIPEIFDKVRNGKVAVKLFRDVTLGAKNEVIIWPMARTRNPQKIAGMTRRVLEVETRGGGDWAETGYQLVIENMHKDKRGTEKNPNVQFIVTDAPEKQPELRYEMLKLMRTTNTRVFVYDTNAGTCIEIDSDTPQAQAAARRQIRPRVLRSRPAPAVSFWTGSPISSRRRGSTGTGITECLRRTTSSKKPSRRWRSGTLPNRTMPVPAARRAVRMPRKAALTRIKNPGRTTPPGLPGRNSWPGWGKSFRSSARGAAATSG